ncbi:dolichyl-phosphate beta-glucosyltransferase [Halyomorpha halys]|uniref:dolichyl-phosphate beta-glucosyltransferase n=1 Tax=Halyomorpha halys TaxID=286706 RepID=UPI0006D4F144|nr:dolichyl-phosphate beta-glucosyltransferase [Halyomorpha halys]
MSFDLWNIVLATFTTFYFALGLSLLYVYFGATPYPIIKRSKREHYFYDAVSSHIIPFPSLKDSPTITLSVIVPAYNEEKRLSTMLDECLDFLEDRCKEIPGFSYEVIIVSDGSTDKTPLLAWLYAKNFGSEKVRLLDLKPNRGKGGAVRLGVFSARGSVILFADADGATKFSDITKLEKSLLQITKCDYTKNPEKAADLHAVICGSRSHLEEESIANRSFCRVFLMHGFHFLVWLLTVRSIRDTQCGFKLFTRKTAKCLFSNIHVERWAFDVELLYLAELLKIPTSEIAVNWTEIDGSKIVPIFSWLQMGKDLFLIWFRYRIGAWKISELP